MEPNDPPRRRPEQPQEVLRRLEERLGRASEAAERLMSEAARSAGSEGSAGGNGEEGGQDRQDQDPPKPPPAGWQAPQQQRRSPSVRDPELLVQLFQSLRDLIPPELQQRLMEALREVLLALRALIDWYLERLERRRPEPTEVEDIPIQ